MNRNFTSKRSFQSNPHAASGIAWIKSRVTKLTNRTDLEKLEIQWYRYFLDLREDTVAEIPVEKYIVNLD